MDQNFLKITYHLGSKTMHAYIKMPSPTYSVLKKEIEIYLFDEREQIRGEIRTYWIDGDRDEIEIYRQADYEAFRAQNSGRQHLHIAPLDMVVDGNSTAANTSERASNDSAPNQTKIPPAAGSAVHDFVKCDSCLMSPIVGFRYKCIQCDNFDLCEHCESKHIHSEHMMVRMPNNNCPDVIKAHVTGRTSARRHGKRSKTSCPYVNAGGFLNVDSNDEEVDANKEQSSSTKGKERYHLNNFFTKMYEVMNDLAEGGGTANAKGESTTSSKTTTSTNGSQTTGTATTNGATAFENTEIIKAAATAATAAKLASQKAHETASKTAEIAAKVAHETALKAAKNTTQNMEASSCSIASTVAASDEKVKVDASTSACDPEAQPNSVLIIPTPSLENLAQFLDPKFVKNGVQILNNFSEMFAKMLDPMENSECANSQNDTNLRKNSTTSTKSFVSSNLNSLGSDKKSNGETSLEKEKINENKENGNNDTSSFMEIDDLGSDSENESTSGSFVKISAPVKENSSTSSTSKAATAVSSVENTPDQSLNKSNVIDFAQLGSDLKAHIAKEATNDTIKALENVIEDKEIEVLTPVTSTIATDPVVTIPISTTTSDPTNRNMTEEKRSVLVYHSDQGINKSVHAMVAMGFSNEGDWLTQLLESVNGNIADALDLMSTVQRNGSN